MIKLSSTPDLMSRYSALGNFSHHDFAPRPTFQNVVAQVFKEALQAKSPALYFHVAQLSLAEPLPVTPPQATADQPRSYRLMPLVDVMIQSLIDDKAVALEQGFHRLTDSAFAFNPRALRVNMDDLQRIINDCSPLLINDFQQALALYWSEKGTGDISPFQWLVRVLQAGMTAAATDQHRVPALPGEQSVAMTALASFPDKAQRLKLTGQTPLHAYLVNIQSTEKTGNWRFQLPGVVVITRDMADRSFMLTYSLERGVEQFRTFQALGASLVLRVQGMIKAPLFTWSLYEPEGDFFNALALTVLDRQIHDIGLLLPTAQAERWSVARLEQALDKAAAMFPLFNRQERPYLDHVLSTLPQWLQQAAPQEMLAYSTLLSAQVAGHEQRQGQTFMDDIDSLQTYAQQVLMQRIQQDHPEEVIDVAKIEINELTFETPEMPRFHEQIMPFAEFALTYRGGWPTGLINVGDRRGQPLPDWLSSGYVKDLVDELDVGTRYIALIKRLLVDDDVEVVRRKALFKSQISVQLSLLALEKKIKGESGFTEGGWQTVNLLMTPDLVTTGGVCIRPLGFHAYEDSPVDWVANMFVFGANDIDSGPVVLYQPFAAEPLHEYPTQAALLDAIKQPGELQDSVLAWFEQDARSYYAEGGFERPHLEGVLLESFLALLPRAPATLSTQRIVGDYFEAMFEANARALMALADKQTVSTSERRWALITRYGWTLFNGLTLFISGPWQKAAWLLQTLITLDSGLQARIDGDKEAATQTVIDLLFNISLALLHEGLNFKAQANEKLRLLTDIDEPMFTHYDDKKSAPADTLQAPTLIQHKLPDIKTAQAVSQYSSLDHTWFNSQLQLNATQRAALDQFAVDVDLTPGRRMEAGPLTGVISLHERLYVRLDGKTYRVSQQAERLVIQHDQLPDRFGPALETDGPGQWRLDLRLRLRGGGPKRPRDVLREKKAQKAAELRQQVESLIDDAEVRDQAMIVSERLLDAEPDRREQFIGRYETEFEVWKRRVFEIIELSTKANNLVSEGSFEVKLQATWVKLAIRAIKLQNYLEDLLRALPVRNSSEQFITGLKKAVDDIEIGSNTFYIEWVEQLKKAEQLQNRLYKNSLTEIQALDEVRKRPLPKNSPLKEITGQVDRVYFDRHFAAAYLDTLCELVVNRTTKSLAPEESAAFELFVMGSLVDTAWSQLNLRHEGLLYAVDHIDFFDQTLKNYDAAESVCLSVMSLHSESFRNEYLPSLIEVLGTLREFAENQMASLIRDSESSSSELDEPRPGPSGRLNTRPSSGPTTRSSQRIIKTTNKQTLVGTLRGSVSEPGEEVVDVIEGMDRLNIHSYRKTAGGDWEKIGIPRPSHTLAPQLKTLAKLESEARQLLGSFRDAIAQNRERALTAKIPVEIEEILSFKAKALDEVSSQIEQIVSTAQHEIESITDERRVSVMAMSHNLKEAAVRLRLVGRSLRISIMKRLPPTGANVDFLKAQGEVLITRTGPRKNLSKAQRQDYMQEYVITELDGTELWFAHFHYETPNTPEHSYVAAHLKTAQQRMWSTQALYANAQNSKECIAVYRAKLSPDVANRLFLSIA